MDSTERKRVEIGVPCGYGKRVQHTKEIKQVQRENQ